MKKKLLIGLCALLILSGCGKVVTLKDGGNAVVSLKDKDGISTEVLYQELKKNFGAATLMDLVDNYLLDKLYETTKEENSFVKQKMKEVKATAKNYGLTVEKYLSYYLGYSDVDLYKDQIRLDYRRELYANDYAKKQVTKTELEDFYENYVFGDIEASQIFVAVNSEGTDEAALNASKEDAKSKAATIISKLNEEEDFAKVAKEYSDDQATKENGGSLGKINSQDVDTEVWKALVSLDAGKYTIEPVETKEGYYILYKTSQDKKPKLTKKLKETIKETIAKETVEADSSYKYTAMKALRSEYEFEILDDEINTDFEKIIENY